MLDPAHFTKFPIFSFKSFSYIIKTTMTFFFKKEQDLYLAKYQSLGIMIAIIIRMSKFLKGFLSMFKCHWFSQNLLSN